MRRFSSPRDIGQRHQFGDPRRALLPRHAPDFQAIADVVGDAHVGKQRVGLKHHADIAPLDRHRRHVVAVKQHPAAGIRQFEAGDDAQHGGLAAAGRAEQHQRFAARDIERRGLERAGAVGKGLAAGLDPHRRAMSRGRAHRRLLLVGKHLHRDQKRNDHDKEDQRIGRRHLQPHRGVAVGKTDRQRLGQRRVQHPGQIEFAERKRHHHQAARENPRHGIGHDHVAKASPRRCAERCRAFVERLDVDGCEHRHHRAHHERHGEDDMAGEDEQPGTAKIAEAAIGEQQRQRDRETGNRQRQRDDFLDDARQSPAADMQRVGRGNADHQRHRKRRECDHERQQDGAGIEIPDLEHPLQGHAGRMSRESNSR